MSIIKKIIYKLHLSEWVYKLECKSNLGSNTICFQTVGDAIDFLHSQSPDLGQSCIENTVFLPFDYDLEVIVPCYNVEKYVEECIDSILTQKTKYRFCVTIVNDGSTDHTREVLRKYENINNVRIIDQANKGHSGARNTAIAQVHGRYLSFVDSDDVLLPGMIEELMSLAEQYNADVVDSGHIRFADCTHKGLKSRIMAYIYDFFQRPQSLPLNQSSPFITGYAWGKVWKTDLFHRVNFPHGYWFEDTIVWMILEPLCKRKVTSDKLTVFYRMNPNSISHIAHKYLKSIDTLYVTLQLLHDRDVLGIKFDQYQYENLLKQMRMNF